MTFGGKMTRTFEITPYYNNGNPYYEVILFINGRYSSAIPLLKRYAFLHYGNDWSGKFNSRYDAEKVIDLYLKNQLEEYNFYKNNPSYTYPREVLQTENLNKDETENLNKDAARCFDSNKWTGK